VLFGPSTLLRILFVVIGALVLAAGVGASRDPGLSVVAIASAPPDGSDEPPSPVEGATSEADDDDDDDDGIGVAIAFGRLPPPKDRPGLGACAAPSSLRSIDPPRPPAPPPRV